MKIKERKEKDISKKERKYRELNKQKKYPQRNKRRYFIH